MFRRAKLNKKLASQGYFDYFRVTNLINVNMASILAFAGSNSSTSINFKLVKHTLTLVGGHTVRLLDMAHYPYPMYSIDYEKKNGFSNGLIELRDDIQNADGLIISVSEHNGSLSSYFKNTLDWLSRLDIKFMDGTKVLLMSTSPGERGGKGSLEVVENLLPRFGAEIISTFSLPAFQENFDSEKGVLDTALSKEHEEALNAFLTKL